MCLKGKKIGILMEDDFYAKEIFYYQLRFEEVGIKVNFLTRLWNNKSLSFKDHDYKTIQMQVNESFAGLEDDNGHRIPTDEKKLRDQIKKYDAIIVPAGIVSDRLRYTEDVNIISPACEFMKAAFQEKNILKCIICHGLWIMSPIKDCIQGRNLTTHNNLIWDAKNMGANYLNEDVVVDCDLITARTGDHCNVFTSKIIEVLGKSILVNSI